MSKTRNLFGKVAMIAFLVMVVVGFTVPIVLNNIKPDSNTYVEPRLCQTDVDCGLLCDDLPVMVLCGQNICQQNACTQQSYYPFTEKPVTFTLNVIVENQSIDIASRANKNNFFVIFEKDRVKVYANGLNVAQILEKANMKMNGQCMTIDQTYCAKEGHIWVMRVKGQESPLFDYTPQEGDVIELVYS